MFRSFLLRWVSLRPRLKQSVNALQSTCALIHVLGGTLSLWSCVKNRHSPAWEHGVSWRKRAMGACSALLGQEAGLPLELMAIMSRSRQECLLSISFATAHHMCHVLFSPVRPHKLTSITEIGLASPCNNCKTLGRWWKFRWNDSAMHSSWK